MKIGLLVGGNSAERDISLSSGKSIKKALISLGHEVLTLDPCNGISEIEDSILSVDLVFNGLHGGDGENGKIALELESLEVHYTGSDHHSSRLCMDKASSKEKITDWSNIKTPKWFVVPQLEKEEKIIEEIELGILNKKTSDLGFPLIVKPIDQGSTIGLSVVKDSSELHTALDIAYKYSELILIESFIDGREITVPIIGNKAYSIVEIIPSHDLYDYECKYTKGMSEYICPADLGINLSGSIKDQALKIHKILDCRHYSRVDFILDKNNDPWFLEINTLPGMTETSLLPKSLKASGVEFKDVIQKIINEAINSPRLY